MNDSLYCDRKRALNHLIERLRRKRERLITQSTRLSSLRLAIFFLALMLVWMVEFMPFQWLQFFGPAAGFIIFGVVVGLHCQVQAKIRHYQAWLKIKQAQYAQMQLDWTQLLHKHLEIATAPDPTDVDLKLTGPNSLHHLINFAVSQEGGQRLCQWLQAAEPDFNTVQRRQTLVKELSTAQRFRDRFLLTFFRRSEDRLEGRKLSVWLAGRTLSTGLKYYLIVSMLLFAVGWPLVILSLLGQIAPFWTLCLVLYLGLYLWKGPQIKQAIEDVQHLDDALAKLKPVLIFLETHSYWNLPLTRKLCDCFITKSRRPSKQLNVLKCYTTAMGLRMNPLMLLLLNLAMPWDLLFTFLIERQKAALQARLPRWLDTIYELEALISLANFAYVNPHYTFPRLQAPEKGPEGFRALDLAHPLISHVKKVRNDFSVERLGEVILITGSNMTGKSTFLKIMGINLKLAYAGGPVDAAMMVTGIFRVMTSIRIRDSLAEETSYFYAEVRRLKQILNALLERTHLPVFFLIDEILKGTNNRERYLGSKSYIKAVSGKHGVGLISTHDLTLHLLEQSIPLISNRHFGDEIIDGKFKFDHKLLPGPSTSTNALRILKSEGLPVEDDETPADIPDDIVT